MLITVFNFFLHPIRSWQVSVWKTHSFKSSLLVSKEHFFGWPQLLYPSISKSKICPVHSSLCFTRLNQRSLLYLNTESKLFSLNQLRREFVLTACFFLTFLIFVYEGPTFLWIKHVPLAQLLYIWLPVFKEFALQVSKGNSSLNFPYADKNSHKNGEGNFTV